MLSVVTKLGEQRAHNHKAQGSRKNGKKVTIDQLEQRSHKAVVNNSQLLLQTRTKVIPTLN